MSYYPWGPQPTGSAVLPARVRKPGGWMWAPVLWWILAIPVWVVGLSTTSEPPSSVDCSAAVRAAGECPTPQEMAAAQEALYRAGSLIVLAGTCAVTFAVGIRHGRRGAALLYGRRGLQAVMALFALPHLAAYRAGHWLGARRPRAQRPRVLDSTEAQALMRAPDTLRAITDVVQARTGNLPGAVLGWSLDGRDALLTATPRGGVLVLGPPGSGKTSAVMIPTVLIAPGAVVSSSIKSDVMLATWAARAQRGRVWHFDPGGDEITPAGVLSARWSPLASVRSWDDALRVGRSMGEARRGKGRDGDEHFIGRATDWVQTLLYAAHLAGQPIATVARWAASASDEGTAGQVLGTLAAAADSGDEGADIAWQKLRGLLAMPDRERGSVVSTMARMLAVYDSLAARRVGHDPNFDPRSFVRSTDTLYITARPDRQELYAPLLAALLEEIRLETYDRTKREQAGVEAPHPHVTFALDEANTTAPIPLPAIISEAGGQGLHLAVGVQALGPAVARWGDAAKSFLTLFPTKVVFRGVFDQETVNALSDAAGEYDRQLTSYSVSTSYVGPYSLPIKTTQPSYQTARQKVLTPGDITAVPPGRALVWDGPTWGLVGIGYHWTSGVWQTVTAQAARQIPQAQRPSWAGELGSV